MYWFLFGEKSNTHKKTTKRFFCFLSFFIFENAATLLSWRTNKQHSHVEVRGGSTGKVYHGGQDKGWRKGASLSTWFNRISSGCKATEPYRNRQVTTVPNYSYIYLAASWKTGKKTH